MRKQATLANEFIHLNFRSTVPYAPHLKQEHGFFRKPFSKAVEDVKLNRPISFIGLCEPFMTTPLSKLILLFIFLVTTVTIPPFHQNVVAADLMIRNARLRATPPNAPVAAGYLTIQNIGLKMDRLIGISAPFAMKSEIHEMTMSGDVVQMRKINGGLNIPPNESVTLKPGGRHIMFMKLKEQLKHGEQKSVNLVFEQHGQIVVIFKVEDIGRQPQHSESDDNQIE